MNERIERITGRVVLTEARLDVLAEAFLDGEIRELTGATFGQFVENPDLFGHVAIWLRHGGALVKEHPAEPFRAVAPGELGRLR